MTCKELREKQLDELKDGLDEVVYHVITLSYGSFIPQTRYTFNTIQEAKAKKAELIRLGMKPGFIRCEATVLF